MVITVMNQVNTWDIMDATILFVGGVEGKGESNSASIRSHINVRPISHILVEGKYGLGSVCDFCEQLLIILSHSRAV